MPEEGKLLGTDTGGLTPCAHGTGLYTNVPRRRQVLGGCPRPAEDGTVEFVEEPRSIRDDFYGWRLSYSCPPALSAERPGTP
jgi:hypothetical protein